MDSGEIVRSGSFAALVPVFSKIRIFALFFSPFITSVLPNTILIQSDRIPVARNQRISSAFPGEQGRGGGAWDEGRWRGTSRELNIPPGQAVRRALDFTDSNQHAPPTHACFNIKKKKRSAWLCPGCQAQGRPWRLPPVREHQCSRRQRRRRKSQG